MKMPDFKVGHRVINGIHATLIKFQFVPPTDVRARLVAHGYSYSAQRRMWLKAGTIEEYMVRAIIEHWPHD